MGRDAEVTHTSRQSVIQARTGNTECSGEAESSERDCYAEENDNMNMQ